LIEAFPYVVYSENHYYYLTIPMNFLFTAHSSLDDHVARWFGLNQSKYQWALDDYYESKGMVSNLLVLIFARLVFVSF